MARYIFITGGVVSSLGKGLASAALGALLQARGFTVVGVSLDDDGWSVVRPWLEEHKVRYPVVLGDEDIGRLYGSMEALPVTFVIGRDGKIAAIHAGLIPKADYEKEIVRLLN